MGFVHEQHFLVLTVVPATLPHQISLCPWVTQDLFSRVLLPETASTLAWHSCTHHPVNPMPPYFPWIYVVECWGCVIWIFGVVRVFNSGRVYFILFYFLPVKRSRRNAEKQVKEEELVLKLCLLLLPVYRQFLQGLVLAAAETTHISVDVSCF